MVDANRCTGQLVRRKALLLLGALVAHALIMLQPGHLEAMDGAFDVLSVSHPVEQRTAGLSVLPEGSASHHALTCGPTLLVPRDRYLNVGLGEAHAAAGPALANITGMAARPAEGHFTERVRDRQILLQVFRL